jgi:uncharacterized membrane protein YcjF (UPF0283 family)
MINSYTKEYLLELYNTQNIMLEGNILKIIKKKIEEEGDNDLVFKEYIEDCINTDRDKRKMRLEITKEVQKQNKELQLAKEEIERINEELTISLLDTEKAKELAENDLSILQQKTQFELVTIIVKMALAVIISVAVITTIMYVVAIIFNRETQIVGSTWSNLFGILLTNSFSIIGTIMGFKHLNKNEKTESAEK